MALTFAFHSAPVRKLAGVSLAIVGTMRVTETS
jgi:hypothetical protein